MTPKTTTSARSHTLVYVASAISIAFLLIVCYWPASNGPFVFDDYTQLGTGPSYPSLRDWLHPETRPVVRFMFAVESQVLGSEPFIHRWVNVGIHIVASMLLWRLASDCFRNSLPGSLQSLSDESGFFIALIWSLHPIQSQSIAYIIQRSEALMGLFFIAFLCCLNEDEKLIRTKGMATGGKNGKRSIWTYRWQIVAILCFLAGLWSKTVMITALIVGPVFDRAFLSQSWSAVLHSRGRLYVMPLAAGVAAALLLLPGILRGDANVGFGGDAPPLANHLAAQAKILWLYLGLVVFPGDLNIDHGLIAPAMCISNLPWILLTALLFAVVLGTFWSGRFRTAFLLSAPLAVLSPTSSFIPTADLMVEHRLYLPLAAAVAGIIAIAYRLLVKQVDDPASRLRMRTLIVIWAAALATRTAIRASDYDSGFQLWTQSVLSNPTNDRAIQNLIDASKREGNSTNVENVLVMAIKSCEAQAAPPTVPLQRLGELMVQAGRYDEAERLLSNAIELDQSVAYNGYQPLQRFRDRAAMHINRALAFGARKSHQLAMRDFVEAFQFHDESPDARAMAASICIQANQLAQAKDHLLRALQLRPDWPQVQADLKKIDDDQG